MEVVPPTKEAFPEQDSWLSENELLEDTCQASDFGILPDMALEFFCLLEEAAMFLLAGPPITEVDKVGQGIAVTVDTD